MSMLGEYGFYDIVQPPTAEQVVAVMREHAGADWLLQLQILPHDSPAGSVPRTIYMRPDEFNLTFDVEPDSTVVTGSLVEPIDSGNLQLGYRELAEDATINTGVPAGEPAILISSTAELPQ